jgi:8-oxo-dGTP diphosphatase
MQILNNQNYIPQVSIDCVIFGYRDKELKVLVSKLNVEGNFWSLAGGFINQHEDIDTAAYRILQERTGITEIYLEQFHVFGNAARNNIGFFKKLIDLNPGTMGNEVYDWLNNRFISIGYYALVDINTAIPKKAELDKVIDWCSVKDLPDLIMDHNDIVEKALESLRQNLDQKLIAFNLLPETFTMKELQELYEAIFDKPFARNNFQKKMLDLDVLERLEKKFTGAANKAPYLYRFRNDG